MAHTIVARRTYGIVFAALLVLTFLTVALAFLNLGVLNTAAAFTIATIKATLVILFFMHVKYSTRLTRAVVLAALYWLLIFFSLLFSDYLFRSWPVFG